MDKQQAIEQLKDLRIDRQSFLDNNNRDINEIYENDIKAIDLAIKALEGTAQEVQKMNFPILEIDTQNNKFKINNNDLVGVTFLNIKLDGDNPLGEVLMKFDADIIFKGELLSDKGLVEELNNILSKTAQEIAVQEQFKKIKG